MAKQEKQSLYQSKETVYPRLIKSKSNRQRKRYAGLLYAIFFLLPWLEWGNKPVIYFHLTERQFHIFCWTFWPQDFMYLAWLLIIAAFALFFFTTIAGRLWCGFLCPQTIWTMVFVWIEEKIEGHALARQALAKEPLTGKRLIKKISKHSLWFMVALITGLNFVAYFYPIRTLLTDMLSLSMPIEGVVWISIFTYLTYLDAGWLREQVCIYMCPYARFQGVMYDKDTLIVTYNDDVGEPRGSIKSGAKGGCIDCSLCVQVCPTGIDIRQGQQIDCINCGLCVDACDQVMQSVARPSNLITWSALDKNTGQKLKWLRPKMIAYATVLVIMVGVFSVSLLNRSEIELSVIKDRDYMYRRLNDGQVANYYVIKVGNKSQQKQHYTLILSPETASFSKRFNPNITLEAGELKELDVSVMQAKEKAGVKPLSIAVQSVSTGKVLATVNTRFMFPR